MYKLPIFYDYVFPTYILPNALITELGIVNYIHTMYSNQNRSSLFDIHSGDVNPLTALFSNSLGSWPNSTLMNNQLNLHSSCYEDKLELCEEAVYFGKNNHRGKYIYPIRLSHNLAEFSATALPNGVKLNGEYFWKCMSAEALEDAQSGRAIIFLDYGQENYIDKKNFLRLHESLKDSGIPKENIVLGINTFNGENVYNSMFNPDDQKLTVKSWPFVVVNTSYHYVRHNYERVSMTDFENNESQERNNYFLFKVRRAREHRLMLLYCFASNGLLEKADWSCLSNIDFNPNEVTRFSQSLDIPLDVDKIKELHVTTPRSLQSENSTYQSVSAWTDQHPQPYKDAYFYVCTETFIHGDFKSLTEKVFKPIVNFMPFVFLAYPCALATLRELGFKTFAPFIDESYDVEPNEFIRTKMIYNEVARLCAMSKKELHQWYWSMKDILVHNQQHALSLCRNEELTYQFIKYLHSRIYS
jgi:hypothetical protein